MSAPVGNKVKDLGRAKRCGFERRVSGRVHALIEDVTDVPEGFGIPFKSVGRRDDSMGLKEEIRERLGVV